MKITPPIPRILPILLFSPLLFLSACSSNNDNSRPSASAVETPARKDLDVASTQVNGSVVKGIMSNADVHFYHVQENAIADTPFASTKTNDRGEFSLNIATQNSSDVIYVEVLSAADGSSTMVCDAQTCGTATEGEDRNQDGVIGFGELLSVASELKLSTAIADFKSTEELTISVTPLSHFAVQRARKKGDLSVNGIAREMAELAGLLNLPAALSQLLATDITAVIDENYAGDLDPVVVEYTLYSAAIAGYANKHKMGIADAIAKIEADLYYNDGSVNRELVVDLLKLAHREAKHIIRGNRKLHRLITQIRMLIGRYECPSETDCGPIDPPSPPMPPAGELAKVKGFVKDFRTWVRELSMQNNPALSNFQSRMKMVGGLWEDDIKVLASALNDVLPGVGQALSPTYAFCYYCEENGEMFFAAAAEKTLTIGDLQYVLTSDGNMTILGSIRDVDVDMRLRFPAPDEWSNSHGIEILAGRLSRDNMDLVISKGSAITAVFSENIAFEEFMAQITSGAAPIASELTAKVNFFVEAEYGITPGGLLDFESGATSLPEWLDAGDWRISNSKAQSGMYALQSPAVGGSELTRLQANVETLGGYLSFNYAVESEAGYDFFNVYVDGDRVLAASGYQPGFKHTQIFLAPGEHTVVWEYRKDNSVAHNADAVWIDNIQFPPMVAAGEQNVTSHNILEGQMSVTAYKLDEPWQFTSQTYLPGDIALNAVFTNDFLVTDQIEQDKITLHLAANIANAADFEPPQPYEEGTLEILGRYTVSDDLFAFYLPDWTIRITPAGAQTYLYEVYRGDEDEPFQSQLRSSTKAAMKDVAGELIANSGIGFDVVVPNQGLFITTLLGSSPWGTYKNSRFSASGGNIYGYLVEPFDPTETEDQYLEIAVAFEMGVKPYDLPEMIFGSTLTRDTLNEGTFEFYLYTDGKRFNFSTNYWYNLIQFDNPEASVDLRSPQFMVENQDGVKFILALPDVDDAQTKIERALEGELIFNDRVYGTIKRMRGITVIEYIDGSGESIE